MNKTLGQSQVFLRSALAVSAALLLLSTLNPELSTVFAQGALTPPGAPAPTFKTLTQVEPRTAILAAGSVAINSSGSYYLTTNINVTGGNAITITAGNLTLDLNGFTVSSTAPSATGTGILLASGLADITILNGHIQGGVTNDAGVYSGAGFATGIKYIGSAPSNVRVASVSVSGCLTYGIYLDTDNSTVVESCTVQTVGNYGIVANSVSHSTAYQCGNDAIFVGTASDCYGYSTGSGSGVYATLANNCQGYSSGGGTGLYGFVANNCYGSSSSGTGLAGNTVNNCYGTSSSGTGLSAAIAIGCSGIASGIGTGLNAAYTANSCYGLSSSGTGLFAASAGNCYGESSSGIGVSAATANNCYGYSSSNYGLYVSSANNCYGASAGNGYVGLYASTAGGCYGYNNNATNGYGLYADTANNCYGGSYSGFGVFATIANNCFGSTSGGSGLYSDIAIGSRGFTVTGTGLRAIIANSCAGLGAPLPLDVGFKYNMP